jgi:hypothetical protein
MPNLATLDGTSRRLLLRCLLSWVTIHEVPIVIQDHQEMNRKHACTTCICILYHPNISGIFCSTMRKLNFIVKKHHYFKLNLAHWSSDLWVACVSCPLENVDHRACCRALSRWQSLTIPFELLVLRVHLKVSVTGPVVVHCQGGSLWPSLMQVGSDDMA